MWGRNLCPSQRANAHIIGSDLGAYYRVEEQNYAHEMPIIHSSGHHTYGLKRNKCNMGARHIL